MIRQTPLVRCLPLEQVCGPSFGEIFLKLECLQNTGSFKLRGASRAVAALSALERARGVVTASAGNHGAGLAHAARLANVSATVVVPTRTPQNKLERIAALGAKVLIEGTGYDASEKIARALATTSGARFVSAFDDPEVIAGNGGSLGQEIVAQLPNVGRVLVPVGGGGLIAGLAEELCPQRIAVVGTQPKNNCAMYDSLKQQRALCEYQSATTVAEGCEGAVCERTYEIVAKHQLAIALVSETAILKAVAFLFRRCGVVAETSAAVPVAALLSNSLSKTTTPTATVVVISGGNIDQDALDSILRDHP